MKRIENYRSGDRAEALGIVLFQMFCAVAPIPRQEDFGLADAVATILRRDGRMLHAEDSLLVQFKSRTEKAIEFSGEKLKAVVDQDLGLYLARVDLSAAAIQLYSMGAVLWHPNVAITDGLVVHFDDCHQESVDGCLHMPLGLSQQRVDEKTNKHKAVLELLKTIVRSDCVITGDAMFCQREICQQIIDSGGDYLVIVKENQPNLRENIASEFRPAFSPDEREAA